MWEGRTVLVPATEFINNTRVKDLLSEFRAYDSYSESFDDWLDFLQSNPRYSGIGVNAKGIPHIDIFDPEVKSNPELLAVALWHDGYATEPDYVNQVIWIMRGPTMRKALEKARSYYEHPLSSYRFDFGETLKRDTSDYRMVWRVREDGSTRGFFICND